MHCTRINRHHVAARALPPAGGNAAAQTSSMIGPSVPVHPGLPPRRFVVRPGCGRGPRRIMPVRVSGGWHTGARPVSYEPGSVVRIRGTGEMAAVLRMLGDEQAEVLVGAARRVVHVDDVEPVGEDPLGQLVAGAARG